MSKNEIKPHSLDLPRLTSIEYPLNVKNVEKVLNMTGGKDKIMESINSSSEPLELRLRPNDPFQHPIEGKPVHTDNLLVKISVPKKKFREQFHGDLQAYLEAVKNEHDEAVKTNSDESVKSLSANAFKAEPVGIVSRTYRFRGMTDYQYLTKNSSYAQRVKDSIMQGNLEKIKTLKVDVGKYPWSPNDTLNYKDVPFDMAPPPMFTSLKVSTSYNFKQNDNAVVTKDPTTGKEQVTLSKRARKLRTFILSWKDKSIPSEPDRTLFKEWHGWANVIKKEIRTIEAEWMLGQIVNLDEVFSPPSLDNDIDKKLTADYSKIPPPIYNYLCRNLNIRQALRSLDTIERLKELFKQQPIWLRKKAVLHLPASLRPFFKHCIAFVAYSYRNGPWRSCYIAFGIDPRSASKYSIYQSESFRLLGVKSRDLATRTFESDDEDKEESQSQGQSQGPSQTQVQSSELEEPPVEELIRQTEFYGNEFPRLLLFLIIDIKDPDVLTVLELNKDIAINKEPNEKFGWFNAEVLTTVRAIVRYKLPLLYKKKPISRERIRRIIETMSPSHVSPNGGKDLADKGDEGYNDEDDEGEDDEDDEDDELNQEEEDEDVNEEDEDVVHGGENGLQKIAEKNDINAETSNANNDDVEVDGDDDDKMDVDHEGEDSAVAADGVLLQGRSEEDLLVRLEKTNPKQFIEVKKLMGIIKQEDVMM